jgi:hypothetical protein
MGKFQESIDWLKARISDDTETLADIEAGHKLLINGEDVTPDRKASALRRIGQNLGLISAYEKRDE